MRQPLKLWRIFQREVYLQLYKVGLVRNQQWLAKERYNISNIDDVSSFYQLVANRIMIFLRAEDHLWETLICCHAYNRLLNNSTLEKKRMHQESQGFH